MDAQQFFTCGESYNSGDAYGGCCLDFDPTHCATNDILQSCYSYPTEAFMDIPYALRQNDIPVVLRTNPNKGSKDAAGYFAQIHWVPLTLNL